ncbi:hypothetical protein E8P82_11025 [Arthrobacter echini]|uniref:Uncharacterized protein n=1 Tax=Arthrobacter echini TaxID=1529066 RepID=A0A4V3Z5A6_9MICC|nr:hypothetical protein [Arthrobacter echini]THJ65809.1 hypothetical protein E8P82_11025 [Arthrobacter echini]
MIVSKKWVAAGSTATLLAGGLLLGIPPAHAAPGDAACLEASTQFDAALATAGINADFVNQLERATEAVAVADAKVEAAVAPLGLDALIAEAERTYQVAEEAQEAVAAAQDGVDEAVDLANQEDGDGDGDPENDQRVIDARAVLAAAQQQETGAVRAADEAAAAVDAALADPAVIAAEQELEDAALAVQGLLEQVNVDEAVADQLLGLFEAFLAACDASAIGTDPVPPVVVPVPVPVTPEVIPAPGAPVVPPGAPVAPALVPAATPVAPMAPAPVATNRGLNVQTAAAPEESTAPALALIAGLLAVGVAVPVATAARMRRLERAQR